MLENKYGLEMVLLLLCCLRMIMEGVRMMLRKQSPVTVTMLMLMMVLKLLSHHKEASNLQLQHTLSLTAATFSCFLHFVSDT